MSEIPPDIIADILSRVPAKSLLRFRCVSKPWRALIDSLKFIKMHLNRTIETNSYRMLVLRSCYLYSADFENLENTNMADYETLEHPLKTPDCGTEILGSCNGLLCLYNDDDLIVIWNPTTRKHLKLPFSDFEFTNFGSSDFSWMYAPGVIYGFGYDRVSEDYKLVRIYDTVMVFSVNSNSWKKVGAFPYYLKYKRAYGELAAGALHWIVSSDPDMDMEYLIAAFDLGTEEFRLVPHPDYSEENVHVNVTALGDSLGVMCNYYDSKYIDIWVMKNYGVKESWTKLFTVAEADTGITKPFDYVTLVAYTRSGQRVFMVQDGKLPLWYDLEKRKVQYSMFSIPDFPNFMENCMCFGSLVRLDGSVSDSAVNLLVKKKAKDSRNETKKKSNKKRDDYLSEGFNLVL